MLGRKRVTVYTDGACAGNPGPGGYAAVLIHAEARKELSGGYRLTTNNRMEILAAIRALQALNEPCDVRLYSDSEYLVKAMTLGWAQRWKANGWMRNSRTPALNPDLWEQLLELCKRHSVEFIWVKGHAGDPENVRCDRLANAALRKGGLPADPGFVGRE